MSETLTLEAAARLVTDILIGHGASDDNAASVAAALVRAEADGQRGHGLSRVPSYAAQCASGKVDGLATPVLARRRNAAVCIDAANGFAYPAADLAIRELVAMTPQTGIAAASIFRSHHFGQAGYHAERLAEQGLVAMVFSNSPEAIAPWGGNRAVFGTNPVAFAAPRSAAPPLVIDLSLSKVARGKVMVAQQKGESIPEGWALDADGNATTDPTAALAGTMLPMGDAKGAALVLMVEILAAGLGGANFGFEASSFFSAEGEPPGVGHLFIAFDPGFFCDGGFALRLEQLLDAIEQQPGARLPGGRRLEGRDQVLQNGLAVAPELAQTLSQLKPASPGG